MNALHLPDRRRPATTFLEEKQDPFDAMAGMNVTTEYASFDDDAISPSTLSNTSQTQWETSRKPLARHPFITAYTFPSPNYHPWSTMKTTSVLESNYASTFLPNYHENTTFRLQAPFIYTSKSNNLPQYQLHQEYTRDGFPARLHIRRLNPNEMRSSSVSAAHAQVGPRIRYDDEETLYTITTDSMKGHKRTGTFSDSIQMSSGKTLWGGQFTRIWRVTHPGRRRNRQRERNEFDKHLLFAVKKGSWEDCNGLIVAREEIEESEKILEMAELTAMDAATRDLMVASWVMRIWMSDGVRWKDV